MRYCPYCKRMVRPIKYISWGWFVLLVILGVLPGVLYLLLWVLFKRRECPICRGAHFLNAPPEAYPGAVDVRPVAPPVRPVP